MRVLVTWGSKRGGTEDIGRILGEALEAEMFTSIGGVWLPLALIFVASWATGEVASTVPWCESLQGKGAPRCKAV